MKNKKILLGVSGGIAAYKSVFLLRLLQKAGADITVILTENATRFVTPMTFQAISGKPCLYDGFETQSANAMDHIRLASDTDLFIIAPATANTIGKIASGVADNSLTTTFFAYDGPVLIAPAMNCAMLSHPIVYDNILKLKKYGYGFVESVSGELACGDEGAGRMAEPQDIVEHALSVFYKKDFAGIKIMVSAGPTREAIDPARYVGNRSSGKMGYAIASEALRRGAEVTLISGPVSIKAPVGVNLINVESAAEMRDAVVNEMTQQDVIIMVAAVADFKPVSYSDKKIKKTIPSMTLEMEKTIDILSELDAMNCKAIRVGFAAETGAIVDYAKKKLHDKNLDMIVANDITEKNAGFEVDSNSAVIIDKKGTIHNTGALLKTKLASVILDRIITLLD